jgi:hypothetical protein
MTQSQTTGYTDDEIQSAVTSLVLSTIRRPVDTLGVLRTDISFGDVQQAAAGVMILYPNAPFYVLFLGCQRLNDQITAEAALISSLLSNLQALGRKVLPVDDVSPLFNVQASLQSLASAAASRSSSIVDVTKAPAYQQFTSNVNQFLSGPGQAVKQNGAIVQTPQGAQAAIPSLLTQLQQAHATLVATVTSLAAGIDDYDSVNLPSVVAQSVLANSATLVGSDAAALDSLTPTQRLADIRQVVLNLLTTQAVVNTFGVVAGPSDFYALDGLGVAYSDVNHLAVPAVATADVGGGAAIIVGVSDTLHLTVDGGSPFDLVLNPSIMAELDGSQDDSHFVIGDGTVQVGSGGGYPNNNTLKVKVGATTYVATLANSASPLPAVVEGTGDTTTAGWYGGGGLLDTKILNLLIGGNITVHVIFAAPADAAAMVAQINTALGDNGFAGTLSSHLLLTTASAGAATTLTVLAGSANAVLGFTDGQSVTGSDSPRTADSVAADIQVALPAGAVAEGYYSPLKFSGAMDIPAGTNTTWTLTGGPVSDFTQLGVAPGDTVDVQSGANASLGPLVISAVTTTSLTVTGTVVAQPGAEVEVGALHRKVRIRLNDPATQLAPETALSIFGDTTASTNACNTLGFVNGAVVNCRLSTPDVIANDINSKTQVVSAATAVATSIGPVATAHTDATNPTRVVFSEAGVTGTTAFAGTQVTYTVTAVTLAGFISTDDTLALRDGPSPGHGYTITTVNGAAVEGHALAVGDVIVATGTFAGAGAAGVNVEFGPLLDIAKYRVVTITGGPNAGDYFVSGQGDTAIDVILLQNLPQTQQGTTLQPVTVTASLGDMYLTLSSLNETTASKLVIDGDAVTLFFTSTTTVVGTTPWLQLPSIPRGLQAGDILEYYPTDYATPSFSYEIDNVVTGLNLIEVGFDEGTGMGVPSNASWQFSVQPVPFAKLRHGIKNDFTAVQIAFDLWLSRSVNQPLFFENFSRVVNPLLANQNPTALQVGAAVNMLQSLSIFVTGAAASAQNADPTQALDSIVQTYTVEPIAAVDTLIQSFSQKGSDRANDLLLQGQFAEFFNLTAEQASYAGAFQAATRAVAMSDLPVRKINRPETQNSQLLTSAASPDFEYTAASLNEAIPGAPVDPPTDFGEPSNYGTTTGSTGSGNQ